MSNIFAILAEDKSDAEALVVIVKRLLDQPRATVLRRGFSGCAELCKRAAGQIRDFSERRATRFIICHDSDGDPPQQVREKVRKALANQVDNRHICFIAVPVQEIESWMIADEQAVKKAIPSFTLKSHPRPEQIKRPKEWLRDESRKGRSTPLYLPTAHNVKVSEHIRLDIVRKKCPSFDELADFVLNPTRK